MEERLGHALKWCKEIRDRLECEDIIKAKEAYQKWKGYFLKYRQNNPDKIKGIEIKYNQSEKGKASKQRKGSKRRLLFKNLPNTLTDKEWKNIIKKYKNRCAYCGIEFTKDIPVTHDHVIPLVKGGHNTKENVVPACKSCNSKKWVKIIKPQITYNMLSKGGELL